VHLRRARHTAPPCFAGPLALRQRPWRPRRRACAAATPWLHGARGGEAQVCPSHTHEAYVGAALSVLRVRPLPAVACAADTGGTQAVRHEGAAGRAAAAACAAQLAAVCERAQYAEGVDRCAALRLDCTAPAGQDEAACLVCLCTDGRGAASDTAMSDIHSEAQGSMSHE
jgi:hypothetical protein